MLIIIMCCDWKTHIWSMYVCIYIYICIHVCIYIYTCMYRCIYTCMYICVYIYTCIYIYICVYMYILHIHCIMILRCLPWYTSLGMFHILEASEPAGEQGIIYLADDFGLCSERYKIGSPLWPDGLRKPTYGGWKIPAGNMTVKRDRNTRRKRGRTWGRTWETSGFFSVFFVKKGDMGKLWFNRREQLVNPRNM